MRTVNKRIIYMVSFQMLANLSTIRRKHLINKGSCDIINISQGVRIK